MIILAYPWLIQPPQIAPHGRLAFYSLGIICDCEMYATCLYVFFPGAL